MTIKELIEMRGPLMVRTISCVYMEGCKTSVWDGSTLIVSPALYSLLQDESMCEQVAKVAKVVHIPKFDLFEPLPIQELPKPPVGAMEFKRGF